MEKVSGLKRKLDELNSELVSAREGVAFVNEEILVLEAEVEAVTDLRGGPLEAEIFKLKQIVVKRM